MLNLCNNSDQTWFCHSLTLQGPLGRLKSLGFAHGFQHFPRDLANVNELKIMFDPSNLLCGRSVMYLNLSHRKTQVKLKDSTMPLKVADCIANSQDPDLIWFYTVYPETLGNVEKLSSLVMMLTLLC